jgi:ATP-dependent helicase/nuclease subunit B
MGNISRNIISIIEASTNKNATTTTVITPNQRLAAYLRHNFDCYQAQHCQKKFWQCPAIVPFAAWLQKLWDDVFAGNDYGKAVNNKENHSSNETDNNNDAVTQSSQAQTPIILLSAAQEYALWEMVIKQQQGGTTNNNADADTTIATREMLALSSCSLLIDQAMEAWHFLHHWQIPFTTLSSNHNQQHHFLTTEMRSFLSWAKCFSRLLKQNRWCTTSELPSMLTIAAPALGQALANHNEKHNEKSNTNTLLLVGFEKLTLSPQENELLRALTTNAGYIVHHLDPNGDIADANAAKQELRAFPNPNAELQTMAAWANQLAYNHHTDAASSTTATTPLEISRHQKISAPISIGCIVPNLQARRDEVERIFRLQQKLHQKTVEQECAPSGYSRSSDADNFNISAGRSLAHYPIIDSALTLLLLGKQELNLATWHKILASPFWQNHWAAPAMSTPALALAYETLKSAALTTRHLASFTLPTGTAIALLKKVLPPSLIQTINNYRDALAALNTKQRYQQHQLNNAAINAKGWAQFLTAQLAALGWPGTRSIDIDNNGSELQALQRWYKLLNDDFAALDLVWNNDTNSNSAANHHVKSTNTNLDYENVIAKITELTQRTTFQPILAQKQFRQTTKSLEKHFQAQPTPTINILGTLEAAGMNFDHLWIMDMSDQIWPIAAAPNPFLPFALQKQLKLPNATAERQLEFCRAITERWQRSAPNIIYSYAKQNNEQQLRPSPLLDSLIINNEQLIIDVDSTNITNPLTADAVAAAPSMPILKLKLEQYHDHTAPHVDLNKEKISGGSGILKAQAQCPFQAFAKYRLHAAPKFSDNLKTLRGNIVHAALEYIWQQAKNRHHLTTLYLQQPTESDCGCSAPPLDNLIADALAYALAQLKKKDKNNNINSVNRVNHARADNSDSGRADHDHVEKNNDDAGAITFLNQLPTYYLQLEQECLHRLLQKWLEFEVQRPNFSVVATEAAIECEIGKLPLHLRIDRIDQLDDGALLLIDYKTGKEIPSLKKCLTTPPIEPQLPLYATAYHHQHRNAATTATAAIASTEFTSTTTPPLLQSQASPLPSQFQQTPMVAAIAFAKVNQENLAATQSNPLIGIVDKGLAITESSRANANANTNSSGTDSTESGESDCNKNCDGRAKKSKKKKINSGWQEIDFKAQLATWHANLAELADRFMRGDAAVVPCHPTEICSHCDLQLLCRVNDSKNYITAIFRDL